MIGWRECAATITKADVCLSAQEHKRESMSASLHGTGVVC